VSIVNTASGANGAVTVSGGGSRGVHDQFGDNGGDQRVAIANGLAAGVFPANAGGGIRTTTALTITNST
jgi:hypothetical protein